MGDILVKIRLLDPDAPVMSRATIRKCKFSELRKDSSLTSPRRTNQQRAAVFCLRQYARQCRRIRISREVFRAFSGL